MSVLNTKDTQDLCRWGLQGLSAGSCGKCFNLLFSKILFFVKMVSDISKRRKQIDSGCVASSGVQKTRCLKKFAIRKVGKVQNGAKVDQKEALLRKGCKKGTKERQKRTKREPKEAKGRQKGAKGRQKGAKGRQKGAEGRQNGAKGEPQGAKREPKGDQHASKRRLGRQGRFWERKGWLRLTGFGSIFVLFSSKKRSIIYAKIDVKKTWFSWKKGPPKKSKIDSEVHESPTFSRKGVFEKYMIIAGLFAQNHDWATSKKHQKRINAHRKKQLKIKRKKKHAEK